MSELAARGAREGQVRLAIMQPYLLPYIGYYQLIAAVDLFVVYDDVKYTKKGWINRNRMLVDGADAVFTVPLRRGADSLDVREREVADSFDRDRLLRRMEGAYRRAPYYEETIGLVENVVRCPDRNLFAFLYHSLTVTCRHLGVSTELRVSSTIDVDRGLDGPHRVLAICQAVGARVYVNAEGGMRLYSRESFLERGVVLRFLKSTPFEYAQFGMPFVPWLSIVDVLMFNPVDVVRERLESGYELL